MPRSFEADYILIGMSTDTGVTLPSEKLADGSRAVMVFSDEVDAETFRIVEELGPEWQIVADTPQTIAELLEAAATTGTRHVSLDPPTSLTRGSFESQVVPISGFVDHLLDK